MRNRKFLYSTIIFASLGLGISTISNQQVKADVVEVQKEQSTNPVQNPIKDNGQDQQNMVDGTKTNNVSNVLAKPESNSNSIATQTINSNNQIVNANDAQGTWGDLSWNYAYSDKTITVSGSGKMGSVETAPWFNFNDTTTINFTGNKIILPQDSSKLFSLYNVDPNGTVYTYIKHINGMQKFDTSNVTNMSGMFIGDFFLKDLDLSSFSTNKVTDMSGMFEGCSNLTNLDINNIDISNVTDMSGMFRNDFGLTNLDISHFDTSNITDMGGMFVNCSNLTNLDVSNFDTSNVTNMGGMFAYCSNLIKLDVSDFDTSNVEGMYSMFSNCLSLTNLDVSNFNTSHIYRFNSMFLNDQSLTNLDISNFDTSHITDIEDMFANCSKLTKLDLGNFDTSNVTKMRTMFTGCTALNILKLGENSKFNVSTQLPDITKNKDYTGKWLLVKDINDNTINSGHTYTSVELMKNYDPKYAGTYTWQKAYDLKDLYTKVKFSISNTNGLFNSKPGDSLKYKEEFTGRSMFGSFDYAYNTKNYEQLIDLMHHAIEKTHNSISSLQVNEVKAKTLGLDVNQLKADLTKDSIAYNYANDDELIGLNNQLDALNNVRRKYNTLVQQGVFDKSNYWTI